MFAVDTFHPTATSLILWDPHIPLVGSLGSTTGDAPNILSWVIGYMVIFRYYMANLFALRVWLTYYFVYVYVIFSSSSEEFCVRAFVLVVSEQLFEHHCPPVCPSVVSLTSILAFPNENSQFNSHVAMKSCTKVSGANRYLSVFNVISQLQGHTDQTSSPDCRNGDNCYK